MVAHFCPVLVCPQKATMRIQFLPYFWNTLKYQVYMKNVVKCCKDFLSYLTTPETCRVVHKLVHALVQIDRDKPCLFCLEVIHFEF